MKFQKKLFFYLMILVFLSTGGGGVCFCVAEEYVDEEDMIEQPSQHKKIKGLLDQKNPVLSRESQKKQQLKQWLKKLESLKGTKKQRPLLNLVSQILNHDPDNVQALNALGVFYLESGKIPLAKIIFTRALKKHPNNSSLHGNLAVISLKEDKKEKAIAGFQKSLRQRYNNYSSAGNLGTLYMQAYEHNLAFEFLELAYSRAKRYLSLNHPKVLKIGNNYAVALARSGYFRKSEEVFRELIKNNPQSVLFLLNYAILLGKDLKQVEKARQFARKAELMDKSDRYKKRIEAVFKVSH